MRKMQSKMKAQLCVLIVWLQMFGVHCYIHFSKNELIKSLCIEKPNTILVVTGNDENEYVDVWNDENDVKVRTFFREGNEVTIKNFVKTFIKRAFSDFYPYKFNISELSSSNSNISVFKYKRFENDLPYEITFYKGFYLGNVQGQDFYQLLGLSSQWLGCPQPICLFGTVDAAFYDKGLHITRGQYYWNLNEGPPMSSNGKLLKELFNSKGPAVDIIDAAFVTGKFFWYFKDKKVYCWDKSTKTVCETFTAVSEDLPSFFNVDASKSFTPNFCEAAFAFTNAEDSKVALYGEHEFRKLAIFKKLSPVKAHQWYENEKVIDFPLIFQKKIDAMVNVEGTVTIFMQWINYKIPITAFESSIEIDNKKSAAMMSFADPFMCSKDLYKGWVYDYDKYAEEMNEIVQSEVPASDFRHRIDILDTAKRVGTAKPWDEQSALPFILAAILITAIIIIIIVILTEKKRRARKRKQQENKPEEVDLRAPAMKSSLDTRSVMGSQILESEYKPGKKGPASSKIYSKVSHTGSKVSGTGSTISSASKASNLGSRTSNIDAPLNRKFDSKIFAGKKKKGKK